MQQGCGPLVCRKTWRGPRQEIPNWMASPLWQGSRNESGTRWRYFYGPRPKKTEKKTHIGRRVTQLGGDDFPLFAVGVDRLDESRIFRIVPFVVLVGASCRIKSTEPAVTALLVGPARNGVRYLSPCTSPITRDSSDQPLVFFRGPNTTAQRWIEGAQVAGGTLVCC